MLFKKNGLSFFKILMLSLGIQKLMLSKYNDSKVKLSKIDTFESERFWMVMQWFWQSVLGVLIQLFLIGQKISQIIFERHFTIFYLKIFQMAPFRGTFFLIGKTR